MHTVEQARAWAHTTLAEVAGAEPLDAQLLLAHVLGVERTTLLAHPEAMLTTAQAVTYRALIAQRAAGVPIAYLTGHHPFYDLDLIVTPDVLIPRPETEHLIEVARQWSYARTGLRVIDVGTGSGAIAITLAKHWPTARVWAVDVSAAALDVAQQNAAQHGLTGRITFVLGDLLAPLLAAAQQADLIVANLPYIARPELDTLAVAQHEPHLALDGGPDGLDLIRRLCEQAPQVLAPQGLLLLEIGAEQRPPVQDLVAAAFPGARVQMWPDYAGHDRVVGVYAG